MNKYSNPWLEQNWRTACAVLTIDKKWAEQEYNFLLYMYTDPRRAYHNIQHIENCIAQIPDLMTALQLTDRDAALISLSLWYHDVIYDVTSKENEFLSACMASERLYPFIGDHHIIYDAIMATTHSTYNEDLLYVHSNKNDIIRTVLDIDLAGLGSDRLIYEDNRQKICGEYTFRYYSMAEWREGRIKFLRRMLDQPRIYYTIHHMMKYEEQARINMQIELDYLLQ